MTPPSNGPAGPVGDLVIGIMLLLLGSFLGFDILRVATRLLSTHQRPDRPPTYPNPYRVVGLLFFGGGLLALIAALYHLGRTVGDLTTGAALIIIGSMLTLDVRSLATTLHSRTKSQVTWITKADASNLNPFRIGGCILIASGIALVATAAFYIG